MKKYEKLKEQYPEHISLEQLRLICRISKRSACYLLENGIIPAIDTGRTTWRWQIAIEDVIDYLRLREKSGSMIPTEAVNSRKNKKYATGSRNSFAKIVTSGQEQMVANYFAHLCADYGDVLTVYDIADITGLHKNSLLKLLKAGHLKYLARGRKYFIPKVYFLEFIASRRFIDAWSNSDDFIRIMEGFEKWLDLK